MMETFKMSIWGRKGTQGGRLGADKEKTKICLMRYDLMVKLSQF